MFFSEGTNWRVDQLAILWIGSRLVISSTPITANCNRFGIRLSQEKKRFVNDSALAPPLLLLSPERGPSAHWFHYTLSAAVNVKYLGQQARVIELLAAEN